MNPRKRAQRASMHAQLINAGFDDATANRIANIPDFDKANRQFNSAMASPPAKPVPTPTPPTPPKPKKPPKQAMATQAAAGQGVRRPKKRRAKVKSSDLRIKRESTSSVLSPLAIGGGGTGMNLGGY